MNFFFFALLLTALTVGETFAGEAPKCKAIAYYHKKVAYNSGIYFHHGEKTHAGQYGSFWDGVNETDTKNIGLKRKTYGYDEPMQGYLWGNALEYGYVGGGKGFILGLQTAIGSMAGLLTPATEKAFEASYEGHSKGTWNHTSGFPMLNSPNGASTATAMNLVLNRTQAAQSDDQGDDDVIAQAAAVAIASAAAAIPQAQVQSRGLSFEPENNAQWNSKRGEEAPAEDDEDCGGEEDTDADADEEEEADESSQAEDDEDCDEEEEDDGKFKKGPEQCAVYRPPWKSAKPVYFHGRCDNCDQKTGFNKNGHGSFQACSLLYQGKEYIGKPSQTKDMYTCVVAFDC